MAARITQKPSNRNPPLFTDQTRRCRIRAKLRKTLRRPPYCAILNVKPTYSDTATRRHRHGEPTETTQRKIKIMLPEVMPILERLKRGEALPPKEASRLASLQAVGYVATDNHARDAHIAAAPGFDDDCLELLTRHCPNLGWINLSGAKITSLAPLVGMTELQVLSLNNTGVSDLAPLAGLTQLQTLGLCNTGVSDLAPLAGLTQLQSLALNSTGVSDLAPLAGLTQLQFLDLSDTGVSDLTLLAGLTQLHFLLLNSTGVSDLTPLAGLTKLRYLDLSNTGVSDLAPLAELRTLLDLFCGGLSLDRIPGELVRPAISLNLGDTVLRQQPAALFRLPSEQIRAAYYDQKLIPVNEGKVIFLGDSSVGKTHTIQRLRNHGAPGTYDTKSTPGIDISSFRCEDGTGIRFWDFGGQEIMRSMHRCFLTERTCYVVVVSNREAKSAMPQARRWLRTVAGYSDRVSVLLAVNQWNNVSEETNIDRRELEEICPALADVIYYSAQDDGQEAFNEKITEAVAREVRRLDSVRLELPESWAGILEALRNLDEPVISLARYQQICRDHGLDGEDEASDAIRMWLLEWFNDLGVCFSYHKSAALTEPELADYKVLEPKWLTNGIYRIINNGKDLAGNGFISREDLLKVLNDPDMLAVDGSISYSPEERNYILEVMRKFERAYPAEDGMEFIPELLPGKRPQRPEPKGFDFVLTYAMELTFLPPGLVHRLMIGMSEQCDSVLWQSGLRLSDGESSLLVEAKNSRTLQMDLYRRQGAEAPAHCELFHEARLLLLRYCREMSLRIERTHVLGRKNGVVADYEVKNLLECRKNNMLQLPATGGGFAIFSLEELLTPIFSEDIIEAAEKVSEIFSVETERALDLVCGVWPWVTAETLGKLLQTLRLRREETAGPLRELTGKLKSLHALEEEEKDKPDRVRSIRASDVLLGVCADVVFGEDETGSENAGRYNPYVGGFNTQGTASILAGMADMDQSLLSWLRAEGVKKTPPSPTPGTGHASPTTTQRKRMLGGINLQLYEWAIRSPLYTEAVGLRLGDEDTDLQDALGPHETHRYIAAPKLMTRIWSRRPCFGLIPPYDLLTEMEFGQEFYAGYRDHQTHMFKVFLLGLYFYERLPGIRDGFAAAGIKPEDFLPTWTMTALTHDVGYLFETKDPKRNGALADKVFAALNQSLELPLFHLLQERFDPAAERQMQADLRKTGKMIPSRIELLDDLEAKLEDLKGVGCSAWLGSVENPVKTYYNVMLRPGDDRYFYDHGIVSACILLYLREKVLAYLEESQAAKMNHPKQPKERDKLLDDMKALEPAARTAAAAVALHNIQKDLSEAQKKALYHNGVTISEFLLQLDRNPYAYLLRLCDELQCWDRQRFTAPKPEEKGYLRGSFVEFSTDEQESITALDLSDTDTRLKIQKALDGSKTLPAVLEPKLESILKLQ